MSYARASLLGKVMAGAEEAIEWFGGLSLFAGQVVRELFRRPFEFTEILKQIFEIGWRSAPLIVLSGLAVGAVLSMHTRSTLERFGAESMIPTALAFALVTETGPLITGLLVSGRVGAGIGAELGGMRVTEQIDALDSLAVNSFKYLVVTRVVACVVALPLLTVLMNFAGLVGGFFAETRCLRNFLHFLLQHRSQQPGVVRLYSAHCKDDGVRIPHRLDVRLSWL